MAAHPLQGIARTGDEMKKDDMKRIGVPRRRPWSAAGRLFLALAALASITGLTPAQAHRAGGQAEIGDTTVFASVPAPGHPFGIAVDKDRVYVSTADGDFYASHLNSHGEAV